MSKVQSTDIQNRIAEVRLEVQQRIVETLSAKTTQLPQSRAPRYDEVFERGILMKPRRGILRQIASERDDVSTSEKKKLFHEWLLIHERAVSIAKEEQMALRAIASAAGIGPFVHEGKQYFISSRGDELAMKPKTELVLNLDAWVVCEK